MNILLIDKRVQEYETIVAAIDPALAVGVVFDYYEDTFDTVKAHISALGFTNTNTSGSGGISVGLIQHNYKAPMFTMLASADVAPVLSVAAQDPALERWTQFRDFITWCKTPEIGAAYFDMMACALYSDPDWKYVIDTLTAQTGVTVRASADDTGAASLGGDWFLESHTGVNLKTVYFTEAIEAYRGVLFLYSYNIREYSTKGFATGTIGAWGDPLDGGSGGSAESNCVAVYSIVVGVFLALQTNGRIVQWGRSWYALPSTVTGANTGVIAVYSTDSAFVALKSDGSVVSWGNSSYGADAPSSVTTANSGVVAVYSTTFAFAALKTDGSVVVWGHSTYGGGGAPSSVTAANSGVVAVYSTQYAFAALKTDGSIVAWGDSGYGGSMTAAGSGVVAVYSNHLTFAALKSDGSIVAWGDERYGGSAPSSVTSANSGVVAVYPSPYAFAALKTDGSVVVWGESTYGGAGAPSSVTAANSGVVAVYSTSTAFAALKTDGSVVAWGLSSHGGTTPGNVSSGVVAVYSAPNGAFAALKSNGSVVAWGSSNSGGTTAPSSVTDANSGVVAVYSTNGAFAALKNDGTIVAWGHTDYNISINNGGEAPSAVTNAGSRVHSVWSSSNCFAALKTSATTFDLSMSYYTHFDRYDILRKKENRRRVNLTTLNNNVFTLSTARDIQSFNPNIPSDKTLRIIVPTYVSSPLSITSTATIPSGAESVIIACDEGEPVTISGTTYVNYGSYVYKRETNNTYTKLTTAQTISGASYTMYGGDGINSSGIALVVYSYTFVVATPKVYGDAPFAITTRPTTSSSGAITYTSSDTAVATIDASGDLITIVGIGSATFIATQAADGSYASSTMTSNVLTVNKIAPTLALVGVASTVSKYSSDAPFTVAASSASPGAVTYTSSAPGVATVGSSTGLVTIVAAGSATITAAQAATAFYNAPTSVTCVVTVGAVENLAGTTVTTSLANRNFTGASFANTVLTNVSLAGATLTNVNFSGATITGAVFSNANIVGATNLPAFSTTQKLQLLRNAYNAAIGAVQITTLLSGTEINAAITTPIPDIAGATFFVKAPAYDASGVKVVTITTTDVSNNASLYIPMNSGETVKVNGVTYTFNGTAVLDSTGTAVTFISVLGKPFRLYAGSIVGLNVVDKLNNVKIAGYGLYDVLTDILVPKS